MRSHYQGLYKYHTVPSKMNCLVLLCKSRQFILLGTVKSLCFVLGRRDSGTVGVTSDRDSRESSPRALWRRAGRRKSSSATLEVITMLFIILQQFSKIP